jgi:hypothetical protein
MAYDDALLYVCYETRRMGPLVNSGNQWDKLFKTGGAVDLHLGTDPEADPARQQPVAGDLRLLMTYMGDEPVAVIYRPVAPDAPKTEAWEVVSPVFRMAFDQVKRLDDVRMARSGAGDNYVLEAAIPLGTLGLKVEPHQRLKMDWGVLMTDEDGTQVLARTYWANKATAILSDAPSEAALHPDMWGYLRLFGKTRQGLRMREPADLIQRDEETTGLDIELELEER